MARTRPAAGRLVVAGVAISHPDRPVFPSAGLTKLAVGRYDETIGDWIVPHRRPSADAGPLSRGRNRQVLLWPNSRRRGPDRFTACTVPHRLAPLRRDPWAEYWKTKPTIPRGAIAALERL